MKKIFTYFTTACLAMMSLDASAADGNTNFTYYDYDSDQTKIYVVGLNGGGDGEYNVAFKIPGELAGCKVESLVVPLNDTRGHNNFSIWASRNLNTTFQPDIASVEFTPEQDLNQDGVPALTMFRVKFAEPVEIPETGVYVGYTFNIPDGVTKLYDNARKSIVTCEPYAHDGEERFFLRYAGAGSYSNARLSWTDTGDASCLVATLSGVPEKGVLAASASDVVRILGTEENNTFDITLTNLGYSGARNVDYTLTIGDQTTTGNYKLPSGMDREGFYGMSGTMRIPLPKMEKGVYNVKLAVNKVDGIDNIASAKEASGKIMAYSEAVKKNPVIEESTCTKCTFCPMGFYGLEVMNRLYPEVIAISYHNNWQGTDPMAVIEPPFPANGNPNAMVDRVLEVPFTENDRTATMEWPWLERQKSIAPCTVEATAEWVDDDKEAVQVNAKAHFILPEEESRYRFEFALIHDNMSGRDASWVQTNGFASGWYGDYPEPEWDKFRDDAAVRDLSFDDIFILGGTRTMRGILGSIPSKIEGDSDIDYTFTFSLNNARNLSRQSLIQDKTKLRVVVMVIDSQNNEIVNAAKCLVPGYVSGIEGIGEDSDAYPVAYYDLTGIEVKNPENGLYIVKLSDGTTVKRVIRK